MRPPNRPAQILPSEASKRLVTWLPAREVSLANAGRMLNAPRASRPIATIPRYWPTQSVPPRSARRHRTPCGRPSAPPTRSIAPPGSRRKSPRSVQIWKLPSRSRRKRQGPRSAAAFSRTSRRYPLGHPERFRVRAINATSWAPAHRTPEGSNSGARTSSADRPGNVDDFARSGAIRRLRIGIPVKDPRIRRRPVGPVAALEDGANRGAREPVAHRQVRKGVPIESGDPVFASKPERDPCESEKMHRMRSLGRPSAVV